METGILVTGGTTTTGGVTTGGIDGATTTPGSGIDGSLFEQETALIQNNTVKSNLGMFFIISRLLICSRGDWSLFMD